MRRDRARQERDDEEGPMKRVLITGANGFLGGHCVRLLGQNENVELHAVVRSQPRSQTPVWERAADNRRVHTADLWDSQQVAALMQTVHPTHLLHLAWVTTPGHYLDSQDNVRWLEASLELVRRFAEAGGKRVVVAGSCIEYDWSHGICTEDVTPISTRSMYALAKNSLRQILEKWCPALGLSLAWGRLFFLYGPGEHPNRFVASVIRALLSGIPFECKTPTVLRDYVYIADAAQALVALLNADIEGTYNIGSGTATTIAALANSIGTLIGAPALVQFRESKHDDREDRVVASTAKIQAKLAWHAETQLSAGLTESIKWWKRQANAPQQEFS
jgi:nucleoside-diphosphate-sugar epimerase